MRVTSSRIRAEHALEQGEGLVFILVDRRLLRVGAQVHDLAQRIERREMLLPVMIEILQENALLDLPPSSPV